MATQLKGTMLFMQDPADLGHPRRVSEAQKKNEGLCCRTLRFMSGPQNDPTVWPRTLFVLGLFQENVSESQPAKGPGTVERM